MEVQRGTETVVVAAELVEVDPLERPGIIKLVLRFSNKLLGALGL